jgi:hypothetical protein
MEWPLLLRSGVNDNSTKDDGDEGDDDGDDEYAFFALAMREASILSTFALRAASSASAFALRLASKASFAAYVAESTNRASKCSTNFESALLLRQKNFLIERFIGMFQFKALMMFNMHHLCLLLGLEGLQQHKLLLLMLADMPCDQIDIL